MVNVRSLLSTGFFINKELQNSLMEGRAPVSFATLGGISDHFDEPVLPWLLKNAVTPNYNVSELMPILPWNLENAVSSSAWIGQKGQTPMDPRDDPFYHPDVSRYHHLKNGEVIDVREVGLSALWKSIAKAYQVSYRTTSTLGWSQADVTTVMIPNAPNGKVVSYQNWEDAASLQCAPSYSIVTGIADPTFDILLLMGYTVNWPDHEGVNSSFACGVKEGQSTLDSIKAFLNVREQVGLDKKNYDKVVMWGYSGGAIATGHAAESLATYAPELSNHVVGAIVGGFVTNITQIITTISGGVFSGFGAAGIFGLGTEYPSIQETINEKVRPAMRWRFDYIGKRCIAANLVNFIFQNIWSYTIDPSGKSILTDHRVTQPLEKEWLGVHAAPKIPMMVYQGVEDEIVAINEVDRTLDHYCQNGTPIDYYRINALEHGGTGILGIVEALQHVAKFHEGYKPQTCTSHSDAIRSTSLEFGDPSNANYRNLVAGKWSESGILDLLKKKGYFKDRI